MNEGRQPEGPPEGSASTGRRIAATALTWATLLAAVIWVLIALRLTREDAAGIEYPEMPLAIVQFAIAVLGGLSAGVAASRAGWYLRTGYGGREAGSSALGAVVAFAVWALLVL